MDFYLDCEFHEDGTTIDPISLGLVAEDGATLYCEFADTFYNTHKVAAIRRHPWLMANVVPHLSDAAQSLAYDRMPAALAGHPYFMNNWAVADEVRRFIEGYGKKREEHRIWTWYGSYDQVMLAQMYGPMIRLPESIPMFTWDLKVLVDLFEQQMGQKFELPRQEGTEHNAAADATWNWSVKKALGAAFIAARKS